METPDFTAEVAGDTDSSRRVKCAYDGRNGSMIGDEVFIDQLSMGDDARNLEVASARKYGYVHLATPENRRCGESMAAANSATRRSAYCVSSMNGKADDWEAVTNPYAVTAAGRAMGSPMRGSRRIRLPTVPVRDRASASVSEETVDRAASAGRAAAIVRT